VINDDGSPHVILKDSISETGDGSEVLDAVNKETAEETAE